MNIQAKLGRRQTEVAEHIGFGYSIKETADMLAMPINTVKSTLKAIYAKVGIQKATELSKFVFCRRFDIPLSMCEPARRAVSICLLAVFLMGLYADNDFIARRVRRTHSIERVVRIRKLNK